MTIANFGPYRVTLANADKVLFPDSGITKGDLIRYCREVAPVALRHLEGRPLTLHRFPDGIGSEGFYQQAASDYFPEWLNTVEAKRAQTRKPDPIRHVPAFRRSRHSQTSAAIERPFALSAAIFDHYPGLQKTLFSLTVDTLVYWVVKWKPSQHGSLFRGYREMYSEEDTPTYMTAVIVPERD